MLFENQLGTLGAGNHYAEVQVVEEVYDKWAARKMGIDQKGQVVIFIHSGRYVNFACSEFSSNSHLSQSFLFVF